VVRLRARLMQHGVVPCLLCGLSLVGVQPASAEDAPGSSATIELQKVRVNATTNYDGAAADGYRASTASVGPLGSLDVKDAPYSITVTSGELIENANAHNLVESLETNPTVYVRQSPFSDASGATDALIRGFKPQFLRDGLYVNSRNMPSVENLERIEVINGQSGFLYGYTLPGGMINYVTKEPTATAIYSVKLGEYGNGQRFLSGDVAGALDDAKKLNVRLNAYGGNGDTYIDGQTFHNALISLKANYAVFPGTVIKAHYYHNEYREDGAQMQFTLDASKITVPKAPDPATLYGQKWAFSRIVSNQVGGDVISEIGSIFTWRSSFNYSKFNWGKAQIVGTLTDNLGNYTEKYTAYTPTNYFTYTGYSLLDAKFSTGPLDHVVTFGYWGRNEKYKGGASASVVTLGTFSLSAPSDVVQPTVTSFGNTNSAGWYYNNIVLGDRVALGEEWSFILGANLAHYSTRTTNLTTGAVSSKYTQSHLSPTASVLYRPTPWATLYATYIEGVEMATVAPSTSNGVTVSNAGTVLPPTGSRQYEVGAKLTLWRIDLAAALFYINKSNAIVDNADLAYKYNGRETHRGIELTATGKLSDDLTVTGGFTVLDAYVSHAYDKLTENKTPQDVPESTVSARLEYAVPYVSGFALSGAAHYVGMRPVDNYDRGYLKDNAIFDLGARYGFTADGHDISLNLNVTNIFDTYYWASYSGSGLQFGAPRLVSFTVKSGL